MELLRISHLDIRFGGLLALEDFQLSVPAGGLSGLIGPNGAGKTTVFNAISGFLRPTAGSVSFDRRHLRDLPPHARTALGMARTFQNIRLAAGRCAGRCCSPPQSTLIRGALVSPQGDERRAREEIGPA